MQSNPNEWQIHATAQKYGRDVAYRVTWHPIHEDGPGEPRTWRRHGTTLWLDRDVDQAHLEIFNLGRLLETHGAAARLAHINGESPLF